MIALKIVVAAVAGGIASLFLFLEDRYRMLASALCAASLASLLGLGIAFVNQTVWRQYGWTMFFLLPVAMGFLSVLILGARKPVQMRDALQVALLALLLTGVELLWAALEGIICLIMALPLAAPLAVLGGLLGYAVLRRTGAAAQPVTMLLVVGLMPGAGFLEYSHQQPAEIFSVTTTLDIAAPPDVVWRATIAPSKLGPPDDVIFRLGIAYPMAAHIDGSGPAATRYCNFSTGDLVEPVLLWDEPRRLRFAVTSNPEPMVEMSPYHIHPPHLHGFLVSKQGQFHLIPIRGGAGTRLEATTWYRHSLQPAGYWRWWSDAIIHRIHARVLRHVQAAALQ